MSSNVIIPTGVDPTKCTAICTQCQHYAHLSWEGKYCSKAKKLSIDPVSGWVNWESNEQKNHDGQCADFAQRAPTPRPESQPQPPQPETPPEPAPHVFRVLGYCVTIERAK